MALRRGLRRSLPLPARPFDNLRKFFFGFGCIFLALTAWTVFFYLPFTWVSLSANYSHFVEPAWYSVLTRRT